MGDWGTRNGRVAPVAGETEGEIWTVVSEWGQSWVGDEKDISPEGWSRMVAGWGEGVGAVTRAVTRARIAFMARATLSARGGRVPWGGRCGGSS